MTSAMRELAAISHDLRLLGWNKLPRDIPRAAVIFSYGKSHLNLECSKTALRFGKIAKYMLCEVYYILDATVDEYIDIMRHFVTETTEILIQFTIANKLDANSTSRPAEIPFKDSSVDPGLLFDIGNSKKISSKLFFFLDGINKPEDWDPKKNGCTKSNVYIIAPYAASPDVSQFDSQQESLFASQFHKVIKSLPDAPLTEVAQIFEEQVEPFSIKLFIASYPSHLINEPNCFV